VLVLTAEEGEGHRSAGAALAAELGGEGAEVAVCDVFESGFSRIVAFFSRDLYRVQLRWLGWTYWLEYVLFTRFAPARAIARRGLALLAARRLRSLVRAHDPDVVVSTHPAVTNVLGHLRRRRRRRLEIGVVASISDFGVHRLWAHPGVDLHLVVHESSVAAVERVAGPASARVVRPVVASDFRRAPSRLVARARLGLPAETSVVVVSGGGWGVGDVKGAVGALLRVPDATVVCVCGRNDHLRARVEHAFPDEPRLRVLGFTEEMATLLAAADVLVDSTIGVTILEALTCGCPIVAFGPPRGHSSHSARMLQSLGLGRLARSTAELTASATELVAGGAVARLAPAPRAAPLILGVEPRVQAAPSRRRVLALAGASSIATLVLAGWAIASPTAYPLVSRALGVSALSELPTQQPQVALIIKAPQALIPAVERDLAAGGAHASFAVENGQRLRPPKGDETLPVLDAAPLRWLRMWRDVERDTRQWGRHVFCVLPSGRISMGAYLLARSAGAEPVIGTVRLSADRVPAGLRLDPGDIVVLRLDRTARPRRVLAQLMTLVSASGLRAVSLSALAASAKSASTARERARIVPPASTATTEAASIAVDRQVSPPRAGAAATGASVSARKTIGAT
jgi:processive 1,2-diacylglycerol beta-glucosyltransferase